MIEGKDENKDAIFGLWDAEKQDFITWPPEKRLHSIYGRMYLLTVPKRYYNYKPLYTKYMYVRYTGYLPTRHVMKLITKEEYEQNKHVGHWDKGRNFKGSALDNCTCETRIPAEEDGGQESFNKRRRSYGANRVDFPQISTLV